MSGNVHRVVLVSQIRCAWISLLPEILRQAERGVVIEIIPTLLNAIPMM